ncbi:GNAT family N-acetyltransferase [Altererythrobacter indicus]|uniref:GNAT family N-acetyltransferase n=1 Tax=Altericroceibacterium indicum TaxID=374177 RepID=A0A845AAS9_9SPHN|nr:GNAT family protein [Altericroceibacterium indicum]MXP26794.1 GNAT family N-acetyltransferase [Altericroceibacterium indicum]
MTEGADRRDTPEIRTSRYTLRKLVREDAAALFPSFSDDDMMKWWSCGPFISVQALADWLVPESGWDKGRSWAITDHDSDLAIGRLAAIDMGDDVTELGYLISKERQGEGIATEALSSLVAHLFHDEKQRRVYADVDPDNVASNKILEKLGFTLEGRLREACTTHIGRRDSLIWGMLDHEWQKR